MTAVRLAGTAKPLTRENHALCHGLNCDAQVNRTGVFSEQYLSIVLVIAIAGLAEI